MSTDLTFRTGAAAAAAGLALNPCGGDGVGRTDSTATVTGGAPGRSGSSTNRAVKLGSSH